MTSADNINLDVLELIFAYLSGNDLVSVALVSHSFFSGVIPQLYSTLLFRLAHAKRYPRVMSPFAAIVEHPEFAVHVRHVDIRTVPVVKSQYNARFLSECTHALDLCPNITSFRCSIQAVTAPFLTPLIEKERLHDLRINANLTTEQSAKIVQLRRVRHLTLDFASWNLVNMLPLWVGRLQGWLLHLTLFMVAELDEVMLKTVLENLPDLLGLHVIGCGKTDHAGVLAGVAHTPHLEALSFTTGDSNKVLPNPPSSLTRLRHLAIDTRLSAVHPPSTALIGSILSHITQSNPPLESFLLKYPDRQMAIPAAFVNILIASHGRTLKTVGFIDCNLATPDVLASLCRACLVLERLEISIPVRDLGIFSQALSQSQTLRTLIDIEQHSHSPRPTLSQDGVRGMMQQTPTLQRVVTEGRTRIWTLHALMPPAPTVALSPDLRHLSDDSCSRGPSVTRCCANCATIGPCKAWRKSVLHIGKILCNKCGLYERKHKSPRPVDLEHHKGHRSRANELGAMTADEVPIQHNLEESRGPEFSLPSQPPPDILAREYYIHAPQYEPYYSQLNAPPACTWAPPQPCYASPQPAGTAPDGPVDVPPESDSRNRPGVQDEPR
ncbi:unnamed protein product [Mycena citricolor]|uniref:GATA-type domain-containing protein n=1 Tax=Mycena citricolor TaxID=2018698 RepID=A0AAD2H3A6_9AGAR|nr:unnamed protein product [Mycena citricolor]